MRLIERFLASAACCALCTAAFAQVAASNATVIPIAGTPYFYTNELVVEFEPDVLGSSVDDLIAALQSGAAASGFTAQFGTPMAVRTLSRLRMPQADLAALDASDPQRRLQNMVVFDFPSNDATRRAQMDFARHPAVLSQSRNVLGYYSTDPLLPIVGDPMKYQWGLYTINAIQTGNTTGIWAQTMGSAYIAMLDNGIQTAPTVHEDLAANYRPQFSYNWGFAHDGPTGLSLPTDDLDETPFVGGLHTPTAGHGTHTAGVVAGRNGNSLGGSGVCPSCSIILGRVSSIIDNGDQTYSMAPDTTVASSAMDGVVSHGAQVINESFALGLATQQSDAAIAKAAARDVVLVAASGNRRDGTIDYPANDPRAIAVGGINYLGQFWDEGANPPIGPPIGSDWSNVTTAQQFVAPAKNVISTFYTNVDWNVDPNQPYNCGDNVPTGFMVGYGDCTGTSMAAPHVAGIIGMMRSADPLKTRKNIRDILSATSNTALCTDNLQGKGCELGVPDATKAMTAMLGGSNVLNRKSPLFSFYSSTALDHFYTYVPQMAMGALEQGGLLPQPAGQPALSYQGIGPSVSQYSYPTATCSPAPCSNTPTAIAVILTVQTNPNGGTPLAPLYRMSYKCGDEPNAPNNPACAANPSHLSHVYSTDETGVILLTGYNLNGVKVGQGVGYKLDGIEGYIFPTTVSQPSGTVKLCRKYDATRDDYVLFTGAGTGGLDCSATTDGYTGGNYNQLVGGVDWIGWVYPAGTTIGGTQSNSAPTVSITSPTNGSSFAKGSNITVKASASDSDGSIANVRFFLDEQLLGTDTTSPYSAAWNNAKQGTYVLTAIATDNRGAVTSSHSKTVTITGPIPVFANAGFESPVVGNGNYQYGPTGGIWIFDPVSPSGGSGISGNGSAFTFQNDNAPEGAQVGFIQGAHQISQTVSFTGTGTYHLQFYGAERYSNQTFMSLQLQVDTINIGNCAVPGYWDCITPSTAISYSVVTSLPFTITQTGPHTITLLGVNDGYDNTIFIDSVTIVQP